MAGTSILVLGGGVGGVAVANLVHEKLGARARVTVVDRKPAFEFPPSFPWVMLGQRSPEQVRRDVARLSAKGITTVTGTVTDIRLPDRTASVNDTALAYDHLVIALGADYAPERIPGFEATAHHLYDLASAVRLRDALAAFRGNSIAIGVSSLPFKCPAAPYETALLVDRLLETRGTRGRTTISFFTPEGLPLPSAGPDIGAGALELLHARGIETRFKVKLTEVRPGTAVFDDGSTLAFDLLIAVPPHVVPPMVAAAGLTDGTGWIPVDPTTMRTGHENVYALGDVASVPTPSGFVPYLPKAGVFAHHQAEVVAHNIALEVTGRGRARVFDGSGACFLMTGGAQAAFVKGNWFATPRPTIDFSPPSRVLYMQRVLFEKYWLRRWF